MKVSLLGHSYVRDLSNLKVNHLDFGHLQLNFSYFAFPGVSFSTFLDYPLCLSELVSKCPDVIVVVLGGNDFTNTSSLSDVCDNSTAFYKLLREKLPTAKIFVTQVELRFYKPNNSYNCSDALAYKKVTSYFNKFLKKSPFIDNLICILGPNRLSNRDLYKSDGVHLNDKGIQKLFDIIKRAIINLV